MIEPCRLCNSNPRGVECAKGGGFLCDECAETYPEQIDRPLRAEEEDAKSTIKIPRPDLPDAL